MTTPQDEEPGQRSIQSIEVGGRLLLALADHDGPMSLKDLAAGADLSPSRAHPYLVSFGRLRLIVQDPVSGQYALGPGALRVGLACLHQLDPVRAAEPVIRDLAERTGFAVAIALWGNFGPTIVRMIEARQPLLVAIRAGTVMSVFGTATGRAFAAALPQARLAEVLGGAQRPVGGLSTSRSRSRGASLDAGEKEVIRQARADIARHGLIRASGQPIPGVNAFSAPCLDHDGEPALVVTMLGHARDLLVGWDSGAAAAMRAAVSEISTQLGWRGEA